MLRVEKNDARAEISSKILAYMTGLCSRADSMAYRTGVASHVQFSGGFAKQNFPLRALFRVACRRLVKRDQSSVAGHTRQV